MDPAARAHDPVMVDPASAAPSAPPAAQALDFEAIYGGHFHEIRRWVSYLGGRPADVDDLCQRVFEVVLAQLGRFDGRNLKGWLYGITRKTVAAYRRRAWLRHWLHGDGQRPELFAATDPGCEQELQRKQLVERIFMQMNEKLRTALILHEAEGYTAEEIAALQGIPPATVHSRLRLGRRKFLELARRLDPEVRP